MTRKRLTPEVRQETMLDAAVTLAEKHGFKNVTQTMMADALGVSAALVHYHFKTMGALRARIVLRAIQDCNLEVLAQAVADRHPDVENIDASLKKAAIAAL